MMQTTNMIFLGSVIALSLILGNRAANAAQSSLSKEETGVPPIDRAMPAVYETATFGLG